MKLVLTALLLLSITSIASAGLIVVDAGWVYFEFTNPGSAASENPYTFTALGPVVFEITDAFASGDSFDVWADGSLSLSTPSVATGTSGSGNADEAWADPLLSHGSLLLGAGAHTVEVFARESPYGYGGAYLQVVSDSVPEPATMLLLGFGLATLVVLRRRRA